MELMRHRRWSRGSPRSWIQTPCRSSARHRLVGFGRGNLYRCRKQDPLGQPDPDDLSGRHGAGVRNWRQHRSARADGARQPGSRPRSLATLCWLTLAHVLSFAVGQDAYGQVLGAPYFRPMHVPLPTWSIVADIGSATSPPNARFLGVRISREDDRHRLTVGIARLTSRAPVGLAPQATRSHHGLDASAAFSLSDQQAPTLIPMTAVAGTSSVTVEDQFGNQWLSSRRLDLSVALALGFAGNLPRSHGLVPDVLASVEPWASPRLHFRRISVDNNVLDTVWHRGAGLAAGLWIRFRWGMGIQAAYDWLYIPHPPSERCRWSRSWSVGGHYAFF